MSTALEAALADASPAVRQALLDLRAELDALQHRLDLRITDLEYETEMTL